MASGWPQPVRLRCLRAVCLGRSEAPVRMQPLTEGFLDAWRLAGAIVVRPIIPVFRVIWTFISGGPSR